MAYTVVWFKRDLRLHDHAPLAHAAAHGPVLCLYVSEPSLWAQPDSALQHYQFLRESLRDLAQQLRSCGARLQLAVGEAPERGAGKEEDSHVQHRPPNVPSAEDERDDGEKEQERRGGGAPGRLPVPARLRPPGGELPEAPPRIGGTCGFGAVRLAELRGLLRTPVRPAKDAEGQRIHGVPRVHHVPHEPRAGHRQRRGAHEDRLADSPPCSAPFQETLGRDEQK